MNARNKALVKKLEILPSTPALTNSDIEYLIAYVKAIDNINRHIKLLNLSY